MSQRSSGYIRRKDDSYETPEWVTEELMPYLPRCRTILEPAAGSGKMARILMQHATVFTADIRKHKALNETGDFLDVVSTPCDGIVTNPPYELAQEFIEHALALVKPQDGFVAMLLRTDFDHAKTRTHLFRDCHAFSRKIVLLQRIVWFFDEETGKPKASPSYNHAWFLWSWRHDGPPVLRYAGA